jgi:hypothetical protein
VLGGLLSRLGAAAIAGPQRDAPAAPVPAAAAAPAGQLAAPQAIPAGVALPAALEAAGHGRVVEPAAGLLQGVLPRAKVWFAASVCDVSVELSAMLVDAASAWTSESSH